MIDLSFHDRRTRLPKGLLELAVLNSIAAAGLDEYNVIRRVSDVDHLVISEETCIWFCAG